MIESVIFQRPKTAKPCHRLNGEEGTNKPAGGFTWGRVRDLELDCLSAVRDVAERKLHNNKQINKVTILYTILHRAKAT